jgi:hypothetical protein
MLLLILQIILIILKVAGVLSLSWGWVFLPVYLLLLWVGITVLLVITGSKL